MSFPGDTRSWVSGNLRPPNGAKTYRQIFCTAETAFPHSGPFLSKVTTSPPSKAGAPKARPRVQSLRIVGIGASAGGLEAFSILLPSLPPSARVAYVLVQHLDPSHRSLLSELLSRTTPLPVKEITPETKVQAGHIYVIPPNCDLDIRGGVLHLSSRQKNAGPARSIDRFLESLAADQGPLAIGVILSGAGSDGAKGLKAIKDAGGVTFAQDAGTAKYDSMPRSAVGTGAVDFVLPADKIGGEIERLLAQPDNTTRRAAANARHRRGKVTRGPAGIPGRAEWPAAPEDLNLRKIFLLLRTRTGTDFSLYRPNTIRRRMARRMGLAKTKGLEQYLRFLREHPGEVEALYQDLLINVTSFFRNPSVFETLKKRVFPRLLKSNTQGDTLRIWVAGCSTGQEPYSIAIAYAEFAERHSASVGIQIFATDVNGSVLDVARTGRYTRLQLAGVSAARLQKFFVKEADGYRVAKPIRDMVIFAQQNVLIDPPFTRVDLISCRNMLIYFEPALQQKIIPSFHYALKPGGFLVLGSSESTGLFTNLFSPVDKPGRIYAKQAATSWLRYERPPVPPTMRQLATGTTPPLRTPATKPTSADDACKEADRFALAKYAPATVVVNEDGDVLQTRGDTRPYLTLPAGKATLQLVKMAREGLGLVLQGALHRARTENRKVTERSVHLEGRKEPVDLEVVPLRGVKSRCFLVVFLRPEPTFKAAPLPKGGRSAAPTRQLTELKREHQIAREQLENLREEHETSVEELQASNEEVQSANEELQSLNEELETSNEELESANEELTTLNEELATRNAELRESEQRLREQAELLELAPVLARSPKDRIIFWNRGAEKLYGFTRDEAIGQTAHLFLGAQFSEPLEKIQADLLRLGSWDGEVVHRRKDGRLIHVATQWVAHHDGQGRLRAVLEVNADISARKQAEHALRDSEEFNQRILESSPDVITVLDLAGRVVFMNAGGQRQLEIEHWESVAQSYWPTRWAEGDHSQAEAAYRAAVAGGTTRFSGRYPTARGEDRWWDAMVRPILGADGRPEKVLCVARDVSEQRREEIQRALRVRLTTLRAEVGLEVARPGELGPVLGRITEILVRHGDSPAVHLWTLNGEVSRLEASGGPSAAVTAKPAEERLLRGLLGSGQSRFWLDVASDPVLTAAEWVQQERVVGGAAFALRLHDRVLGVLALFTRHPLDQDVMRELELTADVIGQFVARKLGEDERQRLLQDAVAARNEALAASQAKDDFIAALSHELRTPLNPVLLLSSEGADNPDLPEKIREDFKMIRNNVSLEAKLIDDLLDLTRIVHGKLSLELKPVDAHAILRDALAIVSPTVEQKRIDLALEFGAERALVNGDAVRLQQVFWNVLNNAVKFTPAGGRIALQTANTEPGLVTLTFTDNGTGLPESELERIFEPFTQGGNRAGGLGLGLAISRQLVEKHGGRIYAQSEGKGLGSRFTITLPLLPVEAADRRPAARPGQPNRPTVRLAPERGPARVATGRTLLLIEDHAATRATLEALLKRRNFRVTSAGSAAAALKVAETGQEFDIVLSDLGLPDSDGYALWAALRRRLPRAVGVALSGYGMEHDVQRSRDAGFSGHLTKPVSMDALDRTLTLLVPEGSAAGH